MRTCLKQMLLPVMYMLHLCMRAAVLEAVAGVR